MFYFLSYKISFHLWNTIVMEWQEAKERGQACNPATYVSLTYSTKSRLCIISYKVSTTDWAVSSTHQYSTYHMKWNLPFSALGLSF